MRVREQPSNLDAERNVLGAILLMSSTLAEVSPEVRAEDFYHPAHRALYEAILALDAESRPVDCLSVADRMKVDGTDERLNAAGGIGYLAELQDHALAITNVAYHARRIAQKARRRHVVAEAMRLVDGGLSADGDDDEYLQEAERALLAIALDQRAGATPMAVKPALHLVVKEVEQRYLNRNSGAVTGVSSGFEELDGMTCGFQSSDLVILAARPSMGKTAMAINLAVEAARTGTPVLVFSLEMSTQALCERMMAAEGNLDSMQLRTGFMETKTLMGLTKAAARLAELPMWFMDISSMTIGDIRAHARRWRLNTGKSDKALVVVDYIGLVSPDNRHQVREREVAEVSKGLKALAKEIKAPVLALSQLNRSLESRADKRPMLSDLRESGAIEQDADLVMFLYRDAVYHDSSGCNASCERCEDKNVAEVIIAKQRNGAIGTVRLGWLAESTKFVNLSKRTA